MNQVNMKTLSLVCPSCGGRMELSADGEKAVCPYCGHKMLIEQEDSAQEEYERRMAKARAEEDIKDLQTKRRRRRRFKGWLIALCVIAAICLINVFIPHSPMHELVFPRKADPFTIVSVKFSGMSGEGRAEVQISDRSAADYADTTRFEVTPETGLNNGDTVTVKAKAPAGWRFEPDEKQFTVNGMGAGHRSAERGKSQLDPFQHRTPHPGRLGRYCLFISCPGFDLYSLPDVPVHFGRKKIL